MSFVLADSNHNGNAGTGTRSDPEIGGLSGPPPPAGGGRGADPPASGGGGGGGPTAGDVLLAGDREAQEALQNGFGLHVRAGRFWRLFSIACGDRFSRLVILAHGGLALVATAGIAELDKQAIANWTAENVQRAFITSFAIHFLLAMLVTVAVVFHIKLERDFRGEPRGSRGRVAAKRISMIAGIAAIAGAVLTAFIRAYRYTIEQNQLGVVRLPFYVTLLLGLVIGIGFLFVTGSLLLWAEGRRAKRTPADVIAMLRGPYQGVVRYAGRRQSKGRERHHVYKAELLEEGRITPQAAIDSVVGQHASVTKFLADAQTAVNERLNAMYGRGEPTSPRPDAPPQLEGGLK